MKGLGTYLRCPRAVCSAYATFHSVIKSSSLFPRFLLRDLYKLNFKFMHHCSGFLLDYTSTTNVLLYVFNLRRAPRIII